MSTPPAQPQYAYYFVFTEDSVIRLPPLPSELITHILTYLPEKELRRMSLASRAWRKMVTEAGLELHRTVTDVDSDRLHTVRQIVDHVEMWKSPLRLSLQLAYRPPLDADPATLDQALERLISVFARTQPFLARLGINSTRQIAQRVCTALDPELEQTPPASAPSCGRAGSDDSSTDIASVPLLRSFALELVRNANGDLPAGPLRLPAVFSSARAPCLHTMTINAALLDHSTVPVGAFTKVRAVKLFLGAEQRGLTVARLFPKAREVEITMRGIEGSHAPDLSVYLAGLELRRLTVDNSIGRSTSLFLRGMSWSKVAEVAYTSPSLEIACSLWPAEPACEFVAYFNRAEGTLRNSLFNTVLDDILTITVVTADGAWRAALRVALDQKERTALDELATLPFERLTSLVVVDFLLGHLLQTDLTLPALRSLRIDCTRARFAWEPEDIVVCGWSVDLCALRCPALAEVQLFARSRGREPVSGAKIELLGWLLTQTPELAITPPRLVLSRVMLYPFGSPDNFASVHIDDRIPIAVS